MISCRETFFQYDICRSQASRLFGAFFVLKATVYETIKTTENREEYTILKRFFQFDELGTNYRREIIGGLTTFLSMAYILFVNPLTLSLASVHDFPNQLRIDQGSVFTATAIASAVGCILMGIIAKYPIAIAPGMGLNAFFAFTVVLSMGISWQVALSGVFISGLIFVGLSLTGLREKIINAIPPELKLAVEPDRPFHYICRFARFKNYRGQPEHARFAWKHSQRACAADDIRNYRHRHFDGASGEWGRLLRNADHGCGRR